MTAYPLSLFPPSGDRRRVSIGTPARADAPDEYPRFLSETDYHDIARRLFHFTKRGEQSFVELHSSWTGNVRWARNLVSTSGEVRRNFVSYVPCYKPVGNNEEWQGRVEINQITDPALAAMVRQVDNINTRNGAKLAADPYQFQQVPLPLLPAVLPQLFDEATFQLDADHRATAAIQLAQSAADAGMLSAGYIAVSANSLAVVSSWGMMRYYHYTWAQYSVTVRDPKGTGSGWAGVDWHAWGKIDGAKLSAIALDKCLKSQNPVAVEPGRYTTILESQAVSELASRVVGAANINALNYHANPYNKLETNQNPDRNKLVCQGGVSRLGERVVDERMTFSADPLDPDLGFPPFDIGGEEMPFSTVFDPITWIENGVLKTLSGESARCFSGGNHVGSDGAFRMRVSGDPTSMEEMIATTKRGLLVTRFYEIILLDQRSLLLRGYTRDGIWLIENGKISKAVKNFVFTESALFAFNNVEQLGVPQRVFNPPDDPMISFRSLPQPIIVPPLKIKDFSFTALCDAV